MRLRLSAMLWLLFIILIFFRSLALPKLVIQHISVSLIEFGSESVHRGFCEEGRLSNSYMVNLCYHISQTDCQNISLVIKRMREKERSQE